MQHFISDNVKASIESQEIWHVSGTQRGNRWIVAWRRLAELPPQAPEVCVCPTWRVAACIMEGLVSDLYVAGRRWEWLDLTKLLKGASSLCSMWPYLSSQAQFISKCLLTRQQKCVHALKCFISKRVCQVYACILDHVQVLESIAC